MTDRRSMLVAMDARPVPTDLLIRAAVEKFAAPRKQKFVSTGHRSMHVTQPGEMVLHLPNGATVKVTTDASGVATQVEEDEHLHAVVRPKTHVVKMRGN